MSNQITLVTAPDDILHDAIRITIVDLTNEQTQIVSDALIGFDSLPSIVMYVWKMGDPITWLLDKKSKSNLIVFNAATPTNGASELITGYMAAHPNAHYFGTLKDLSEVNKRAIYSTEDFKGLIAKQITKYEQSLQ